MHTNIKNFLKRNSPVFTVGVITLVIFILIIIASQRKKTQAPVLQEISESELLSPHTYIRGDMKAPVTLVMFCDFNEPKCSEYYTYVDSLYQNYKNYLKIAFRHFAPNEKLSATAAQAAGEQNKFWEFAEILFDNPKTEKTLENLINFASLANLNTQKFTADLNQGGFVAVVDEDTEFANRINIQSTPAFLLNGQKMEFKDVVDFKDQVEEEIKKYMPETKNSSINTTGTNPATQTQIGQDVAQGLTAKEIEESKTTKEIAFTETGWDPQSTYGYSGQLVRWTNQTTQSVKLVQLDQKFPELKKGVEIPPGESFEFRLYKDRIWRYIDEYTGKWADIFIK